MAVSPVSNTININSHKGEYVVSFISSNMSKLNSKSNDDNFYIVDNNIAEIGGGYGGQALVYNQMFKYNAYTIFDLEPVCRLVDKYLGNFYLTGGIRALDINKFPLGEKKFDLVISNYAFSELPKKLQEIYLNKVILNSKCGYMTMNTGYDLKGFRRESRYNCSELLDMLPNSRVIEEKPLTGKKNYIIAWGE